MPDLLQRELPCSEFCLDREPPLRADRLPPLRERCRQRLQRLLLLFALDELDALADLAAAEHRLLPGRRRAADEPALRDQAHPLPAVQRAIGDAGDFQQLLLCNQIFLHILTSRNNVP